MGKDGEGPTLILFPPPNGFGVPIKIGVLSMKNEFSKALSSFYLPNYFLSTSAFAT